MNPAHTSAASWYGKPQRNQCSSFLKQIGNWGNLGRKMANKSPVKIGKAQKSLDVLDVVRCWPLDYSLYLSLGHGNPLWSKNEA